MHLLPISICVLLVVSLTVAAPTSSDDLRDEGVRCCWNSQCKSGSCVGGVCQTTPASETANCQPNCDEPKCTTECPEGKVCCYKQEECSASPCPPPKQGCYDPSECASC